MTTPTQTEAVQMPLPDADAWLIESPNDNTTYRAVYLHNPIGDYRAYNVGATSTKLYGETKLQAHATQRTAELEAKLAAAEKRNGTLEAALDELDISADESIASCLETIRVDTVKRITRAALTLKEQP